MSLGPDPVQAQTSAEAQVQTPVIPTVMLVVGTYYFASASDGTMWCTEIITNGQPDFSNPTQVTLTDDGGANRFTGVRSALRGGNQVAQALGLMPTTLVDSQPSS